MARTAWFALLGAFLVAGSLSLPMPDAPDASATVAGPTWASPSSASIRGGVQVYTASGQCTSNFVFYKANPASPSGYDIYLGMAAHCASLGGSSGTNGCTTPARGDGAWVGIEGALYAGRMDYNSWNTMKAVREGDPYACAYNDFALVWIDPRDHGRIYPGMLHFGGPTGLAQNWHHQPGDAVHSYGRSSLRPIDSPADWKSGWIWASSYSGWQTTIYTATAGIPGDSGSGVMLGDGRAHGTVSTLILLPWTAANGITVLDSALDYMAAKKGWSPTLATAPLEFPLLVPDL
jgi:hypothetical protein